MKSIFRNFILLFCIFASINLIPCYAITTVDEIKDLDSNHWAYESVRDLVEKYDVIEGYPDHTFLGNQPLSRYEAAVLINALIKSIGRDLARLGAEKSDRADLEMQSKLLEEMKVDFEQKYQYILNTPPSSKATPVNVYTLDERLKKVEKHLHLK